MIKIKLEKKKKEKTHTQKKSHINKKRLWLPKTVPGLQSLYHHQGKR